MRNFDSHPIDYVRGRPLYAVRAADASAETDAGATVAGRQIRADASREVDRAMDHLHRVAAAAHAAGLLGESGVRELRRLYKTRRHAFTPEALSALATRYEEEAARLLGSMTSEQRRSLKAARPVSVNAECTSTPPQKRRRRATLKAMPFLGAASIPTRPRATWGPAELSAEEVREQAAAMLVAAEMARGKTARQALLIAGVPFSPSKKRWAQRQFAKLLEEGQARDRRRFRDHAPTVMTPEMQQLVFALWDGHRGCTARGVLLMVKRHVELLQARLASGQPLGPDAVITEDVIRNGGPLPSVHTLRAFLRRIPPRLKTLQALGTKEYLRQNRTVVTVETAARSNEEWQADHTPLDIYVRVKRHGQWTRRRPFLTAALDTYSRAIAGMVISTRHPDAWTNAHLLRQGILAASTIERPVFGVPDRVVLDQGKDFKADALQSTLQSLGCHVFYCRAHNPDEKAEIERFFRTLTYELLPTLPGYTRGPERGRTWSADRIDKLLTVTQLRTHVERWIAEDYHRRQHDGTGEAPAARWIARAGTVKPIAASILDPLLLLSAERTVVRGAIRFTPSGSDKRGYYAPELAAFDGRRVRVRYNPDDLRAIIVYDLVTGQRIGEAELDRRHGGRYSPQQIVADDRAFRRSVRASRAEVAARLPDYFAQTAAEDRPDKHRPRTSMSAVPATGEIVTPTADDEAASETAASAEVLRSALSAPMRPEPAPLEDVDELIRTMKGFAS